MFFASRRRQDSDPHLDWKVRLFFIGAFLAAVGIAAERAWLVVAAIVVLFIGVGLRFLPGPGEDTDEP